MPKAASPSKVLDLASTSTKARFFYAGVFALQRRKEELSNPKAIGSSQEKKSVKK
jgi:hypothetical protein